MAESGMPPDEILASATADFDSIWGQDMLRETVRMIVAGLGV